MALARVTGILLIVLPLSFNVFFFLLQRAFEYPDILRKPTDYILARFLQGGSRLIALWYGFMFTGILFISIAILLPQVLAPNDLFFIAFATAVGVLAGLVQTLGLIRWTFLVPFLARAYTAPAATTATKDAIEVVFQAFHRYAGVALGEHLGYLFTGIWTLIIVYALITSTVFPTWLGWLGLIPAVGILIGVLEETGFKPAGAINAISYILWSVWLIALGILLLLG